GVFRSTDYGKTWIQSNDGMIYTDVLALTSHDKDLFAGTLYNGSFRSTDRGVTWTMTTTGLINKMQVQSITVIDSNLFAGIWPEPESGLYGWVYRSTDRGMTWYQTHFDQIFNAYVKSVYNLGKYLFSATYGGGVFRSGDYGET